MRRLVCLVRGHDDEPVRAGYPWVVPTVGLVMQYVPDPEGESRGCRRCGRVVREEPT